MLAVISLRNAAKFWDRSFRSLDDDDFEDECLGRSRKLRRLNPDINFMASEDFLERPLKSKKILEIPIIDESTGRKIVPASRQHKNRLHFISSAPDGRSKTAASKEVIEISDDDDEQQGIDVLLEWEAKAAKSKQESTKENSASKNDQWQDSRKFRKALSPKGAIAKDTHSKTPSKLLSKVTNGSEDDEEVKVIKETKPPLHTVSVFTTPRGQTTSVNRVTGSSHGKYKLSAEKQSKLNSAAKNSSLSSSLPSRCTEERKKLAINEVASAEDRHLYSAILQRFTKVPMNLLQTMPVPRNTREAEESLSSIDLNKSRLQRKSPDVQFVDLTALEEPLSSAHTKVKKGRESEPHTSSKDDEIQVVDSSIRYTNSLEETLKSRDVYREDYTKSIKEKYERKQKELEQQRKIEEMKAGYSALRNKKVHVESIERLTKYLKITGADLQVEPEERPDWPQLTPEIEREIDAALYPKPQNEVLVEAFSLRITRRDMHTLADRNWLNDEVINFYMNLLIERGKEDNYPKVYAFNTFFYPKLMTGGQAALKRWTRKIDIFSYKMIFVPVHLGMHWCMAVLNLDTKCVKYYDSMGSSNDNCLMALLTYLEDESMDKKKTRYDTSDWTLENVKDIPHQMNGSDCGVFSCMYAEFIAREAKITFTQEDMPYFRRKMVYEIKKAKLLM